MERRVIIGTLEVSNPVFLAPMAGITDSIFRQAVRACGCSLCFTEMISAAGLVRNTLKTLEYLESSDRDRPLGAQIFGSDPDVLSRAARYIVERGGADLIDINMGCPVRKVIKTGAGGALMREPARVKEILLSMRKACGAVPLTVKIRSGWKREGPQALLIARLAEECGVDAVVLHPRTVEQGFSGSADWDLIREVKESVSIPVIGSGDIRNGKDARRMLDMTGCDGVMIGRAALGNPWICGEALQSLSMEPSSAVSLEERERMIRWHLNAMVGRYGEKAGVRKFRKHLLWYTKGLRGGARFREAAAALLEKDVILERLHEYFVELDTI
ncbi:MAG: tRNA dihydrouridine synthase DusB [Deltaproteobacteria bacterium]|nr:tRNA dihydrouridine synthase DusB [Deltaproteobacteria bacterium]